MSDIISQAMGILGGGKKKDAPPNQPTQQRPLTEQSPVRTGAPAPTPVPTHTHTHTHGRTPAQVRDRMTSVERKVVSELARFAALHAQIIEIRQQMERGESHTLVENRLEDTLRIAKITVK
jgi:hypothetical protein